MKQDPTYRIGAYLYDLYNNIDSGFYGSLTKLREKHIGGSEFNQVIKGWLVKQSDIEPKKWLWIAEPPSDAIIEEATKRYSIKNKKRNQIYGVVKDVNPKCPTLDFDTTNLSAEKAEIKKRVDDAVNNMYIQLAKILTDK
jgi:hypothetical protein